VLTISQFPRCPSSADWPPSLGLPRIPCTKDCNFGRGRGFWPRAATSHSCVSKQYVSRWSGLGEHCCLKTDESGPCPHPSDLFSRPLNSCVYSRLHLTLAFNAANPPHAVNDPETSRYPKVLLAEATHLYWLNNGLKASRGHSAIKLPDNPSAITSIFAMRTAPALRRRVTSDRFRETSSLFYRFIRKLAYFIFSWERIF
jgi:hypothetical protein